MLSDTRQGSSVVALPQVEYLAWRPQQQGREQGRAGHRAAHAGPPPSSSVSPVAWNQFQFPRPVGAPSLPLPSAPCVCRKPRVPSHQPRRSAGCFPPGGGKGGEAASSSWARHPAKHPPPAREGFIGGFIGRLGIGSGVPAVVGVSVGCVQPSSACCSRASCGGPWGDVTWGAFGRKARGGLLGGRAGGNAGRAGGEARAR